MFYAQLDLPSRIVVGVSDLHSENTDAHMVAIDTLDASLIGKRHDLQTNTFEDVPPVPVIDPCVNLIDIGPFFDRLGPLKMAVLTCADAGVKAIIADVSIRKWLDLTRTEVAQSLAYIGSVVTALTPAIQHTILTTPVTAIENLALRKLYF